MPDWIQNEVKIYGPNLMSLKEFLKEGTRPFSLNKIVPMPECLDVGGVPPEFFIKASVKAWLEKNHIEPKESVKKILEDADPEDAVPDIIKDAEKFYKAIDQTGYWSWYEWCCDHWGTKWDTCDSEYIDENGNFLHYTFLTAWAMPFNALIALSNQYPQHKIEVHAGYESCRPDCIITFQNGSANKEDNTYE